ncbi:hypothetical protein, partial [uncultured Ruminococcus sp.]|uniref:hypothetical protein n=1 Tax=uncultured Ruminococcus sp. TaxID=165186 RepID=UPI00266BE302
GISGQYDGKSARRLRAKPSGGLCAVLPQSYCLQNRKIYTSMANIVPVKAIPHKDCATDASSNFFCKTS